MIICMMAIGCAAWGRLRFGTLIVSHGAHLQPRSDTVRSNTYELQCSRWMVRSLPQKAKLRTPCIRTWNQLYSYVNHIHNQWLNNSANGAILGLREDKDVYNGFGKYSYWLLVCAGCRCYGSFCCLTTRLGKDCPVPSSLRVWATRR